MIEENGFMQNREKHGNTGTGKETNRKTVNEWIKLRNMLKTKKGK
jgi:hypothetical protein